MDRVGFEYPVDKLVAPGRAAGVPSRPTTLGGAFDDRYMVSGNALFRPVRVYNDGIKTIIEMPKAMAATEAPTLLAVRDSGTPFKKDEQVMVNYRLQGSRYIVDTLFEKAILIAGVGTGQKKIVIERVGP